MLWRDSEAWGTLNLVSRSSNGKANVSRSLEERRSAETLRDDEGNAPVTEAPIHVPELLLQRYEVREQLGSGALGLVYAAWDPKLQRRVAVKLVRPKYRKRSKAEKVRARVLREAQSLARLSHPNVVAVYDFGRYDDPEEAAGAGVFLAMELLDGQTLAAWAQTPRTLQEITKVFVEAGHGLAAAHATELVHRDFKPDNVMVTREGTTKVLDFGLARGPEPSTESISVASGSDLHWESDIVLDHERLTQTGVVLGTPRYMAPEQYAGADVGPAADQFSFCLAFLEAVQQREVFAGETYGELASAKRRGAMRPPPAPDRTPSWLRRVLERGLHPDPTSRWRSMEHLLAALERGPARAQRRWLMGAGAAAIGLTAASIGWGATRDDDCGSGSRQLDSVWNDDVRSQADVAFDRVGRAYGAQTWSKVEERVDSYTQRWQNTYVDVCEARGEGQLDDRTFDTRMSCLRRGEASLSALLELFAQPDETVAQRAVAMTSALPNPQSCGRQRGERGPVETNVDPAVAGVTAEVRGALARIDALARAGRFVSARERLEAAAATIETLDAPMLEAELALAEGALETGAARFEAAERALERALLGAQSNGYDEIAAEAAISLVECVGIDQARHVAGLRLVGRAEAWVERIGQPTAQSSRLLGAHGRVLNLASQYDEAQTVLESALNLLLSTPERDDLELAEALSNLATNLRSLGRFDQAIARMREAHSIVERVLGPNHPTTATYLLHLSDVQLGAEDLSGARLGYQRAIERFEAGLGPEHPRVAQALLGWGEILGDERKYAEAGAAFERARAIYAGAFGTDDVRVARSLSALSKNELRQNHHDAALTHLRAALEIYENTLGSDHHRVGEVLASMSWQLRMTGDRQAGREYLARAYAILKERVGEDHPSSARAYMLMGYMSIDEGKLFEAEAFFRRALTYAETHNGSDHPSAARAMYGLCNVLQRRDEHEEAELLLRRVLDILYDLGETGVFRTQARRRLWTSLWALGRHDEAREEARRTLEELRRGIGAESHIPITEDWLKRHPE